MKRYFVGGIGTDIGKTICAAILVEALHADYWKPVQAGSLEFTDTMCVRDLITNSSSKFHAEKYILNAPMSPHAAAKSDGIEIHLRDFILPDTKNNLIIEGAGGLLVPLNHQGDFVIDLAKKFGAEIILISKNYLGSINHTLLSIEAIQKRNIQVKGIIFNGEPNDETESIICKLSGLKKLGSVPLTEQISREFIFEQASKLRAALER
ncbi:MAG: dethiobiotin synthase [Crocinitomicaceae bacterium]|nr:dethiobiotin synthase [Crocinitomicaceae bacterium]MBK8926751.1 dethiobiotin synthase [Crocinitomicaceae bacterium]